MRRRVASAVPTIRARETMSCALVSALEIAVPTSSVNAASLASTFRGSRPLRAPAIMTPHRWSSTLMGAPTKDRIPAADPAADTGAVPLP